MSRRKSVDIGKNRYGLDMSYFRNLFDRELSKPLSDFTPKELARVLARASRTADPDVMHEPEFLPGMAIVPVERLTVEWANKNVVVPPEVKGRVMSEMFWRGVYAMLAAAKEKGE